MVCAALRERVSPVLRSARPRTLSGLRMMRAIQRVLLASGSVAEGITHAHSWESSERGWPTRVRVLRLPLQQEQMQHVRRQARVRQRRALRSSRIAGAGTQQVSWYAAQTVRELNSLPKTGIIEQRGIGAA